MKGSSLKTEVPIAHSVPLTTSRQMQRKLFFLGACELCNNAVKDLVQRNLARCNRMFVLIKLVLHIDLNCQSRTSK